MNSMLERPWLEEVVALPEFQTGETLIQLYHNFVTAGPWTALP